MLNVTTFRSTARDFLVLFNQFSETHGLGNIARVDHLGYKCESSVQFEQIRAFLEPECVFIYQSYISGRRIAILKLKTPFETSLGSIEVLELSDQKPDGSQTAHFDHAEIYPVGMPYEEFAHRLEEKGVELEKTERPHHTTYDLVLGTDMKLKLTREPLSEKIKRDEMV